MPICPGYLVHEDRTSRPIALIGIMGAGKSTLGAQLAEHLGISFVDTDSAVVTRTGRDIAQIFSKEGEAEFRRLESEALQEALTGGYSVIACGGGIVESPSNRELLSKCTVVYLSVSAQTAALRCGDGEDRPMLGADIESSIARLLDTRVPIYEEIADFVVDAEASRPDVLSTLLKTVKR